MEKVVFDNLIQAIQDVEKTICSIENALCVNMDNNLLASVPDKIINAIVDSYFPDNIETDDIYRFVYDFIYNNLTSNNPIVYDIEAKDDPDKVMICGNIDDFYNILEYCSKEHYLRLSIRKAV